MRMAILLLTIKALPASFVNLVSGRDLIVFPAKEQTQSPEV